MGTLRQLLIVCALVVATPAGAEVPVERETKRPAPTAGSCGADGAATAPTPPPPPAAPRVRRRLIRAACGG